jgi:hypothetical protein
MGFCSVERFWIKLHFDKYLAVKISLRKGDMEKINCNPIAILLQSKTQ